MDQNADDEADLIEAGRKLFALPCRFMAGAASLDGLPDYALPEVALAGRSNVGKSSLINALTGQRVLARVSHTPGRTQQINFFSIGDRLCVVDMPGYGYAQVSRRETRQWGRLIRDYARGRPVLRRLCLLIDSRHGLKDSDREFMTLLDQAAVSYQIILTKADKLPAAQRAERIAEIQAVLARRPAAHPDILITSAHEGAGIDRVRAALAALALPAPAASVLPRSTGTRKLS